MQHTDARFLELLERWQSGDFTRADEQELNALAASDDFRREALEGFMSMPEAAHDENLRALRLRLKNKAGGGRLIALPQVLSVAAAIVLLLAAVWMFPQWNRSDVAPVAQSTEAPAAEKPLADSATPIDGLADNTPMNWSRPDQQRTSPASGPATSIPGAPPGASPVVASDDIAAVTDKSEDVAMQESESDAFVAAPPPSTASAPGGAQPEKETSDKLSAAPQKNEASGTAAGPPAEAAKAKKAMPAARAKDNTWHETDRKPDMAAEKKAAREKEPPKESLPEGGWDAFNDYVRQSARLSLEARNHNVSGTVQLQFNINGNNEPQGFVVLRSVGYGCDQEAIRLVQNWEWVRGLNPIVTVDVPFVR